MIIVQTQQALTEMCLSLRYAPLICWDTETTGLDPHTGRLLLMSFYDGVESYVVDCTVGLLLEPMRVFFENTKSLKIAHNATFDWKWIKHHLNMEPMPNHCTMICEQELRAGLLMHGAASLKAVALRRLKRELKKDTRQEFINAPLDWHPAEEHLIYAAEDAEVLMPIYEQQMDGIARFKLEATYALDMRNIPIAAGMELKGVYYNKEKAEKIGSAIQPLLSGADQALQELFIANGAANEIVLSDVDGLQAINIGSNPQMMKALHSVGVDVPSLGENDLLEWDANNSEDSMVDTSVIEDQEMASAILDYQGVDNIYLRGRMYYTQLRKLHSTYIVGMMKRYNEKTGSIHFGMSVCGAHSTGRYSSSPNGQNLPRDDKLVRLRLKEYSYRSCFEARPGKKFIVADLAGIELVIAAAYSEDKKLISLLPPDDDPHGFMANHLFHVPRGKKGDEPYTTYRNATKTLNYAIPYGTTEYNLSRTMSRNLASLGRKVTVEEAREFLNEWRSLFPDAIRFLDTNAQKAIKLGYTESINGRKRFWGPERNSQRWMQRRCGREGQNHPIQASSADMLKIGMILIDEAFRELNRKYRKEVASLLLCVHDEVVCEVDDFLVEEATQLVGDLMSKAGAQLFPTYGRNILVEAKWSDCYNK